MFNKSWLDKDSQLNLWINIWEVDVGKPQSDPTSSFNYEQIVRRELNQRKSSSTIHIMTGPY